MKNLRFVLPLILTCTAGFCETNLPPKVELERDAAPKAPPLILPYKTPNQVVTVRQMPDGTRITNVFDVKSAKEVTPSSVHTYVSPSGGGYSGGGNGYRSSGSKNTPGTDVSVSGYTKKDGTHVAPHTRSAPHSK